MKLGEMKLEGIARALREGGELCAFCAKNLRIVQITKNGVEVLGHGAHLHIEEALLLADENYQRGHREAVETDPEKLYPVCSGSFTSAVNVLDAFVHDGFLLRAFAEDEKIVVELCGVNAYFFTYSKTGRGADFSEALEKAFDAKEVVMVCK